MVEKLDSAKNVPLGIAPDTEFEQQTIELEPGSIVVAYTDGVTEATNLDNQEFGEQRLTESLRNSDGSAKDVLRSVLSAVTDFQGQQQQADDITLVCFGPTAS